MKYPRMGHFTQWHHLPTITIILWGKLLYSVFFSFVSNHSCVTQIWITKIVAKCILVVVVNDAIRQFGIATLKSEGWHGVGWGGRMAYSWLLSASLRSPVPSLYRRIYHQYYVESTWISTDLDSSANKEVHQHWLYLCLARLEVISTNECLVLLSKFNHTRNIGVLRGPIDEWTLQKKIRCQEFIIKLRLKGEPARNVFFFPAIHNFLKKSGIKGLSTKSQSNTNFSF